MTLRKAVLILIVGGALTVIASWNIHGTAVATWTLAARAGGGAAAAGLVGAIVLAFFRGRSLVAQMAVATLTTVAAVAAGALVAGTSMFSADPPFAALGVVLASSGTVGVLVGLLLGSRVAVASAQLAEAARRIGEGRPAANVSVNRAPTEELATLAHELEKTSRRLEESRAYATQLEDSRRELVSWVSHDLRTPLARIRAVIEALEDGIVAEPAEVATYLERIRLETDRLAGLVDALFELNRINAGSIELQLQPTRLGDVVSDLVSAFVPLAEAREVELTAELHGKSPVVLVSMEHLERALSNLLDNAIRYSDPGHKIGVDVGVNDDRAYVSVTDGCGGIDIDELRRMFEFGGPRVRMRHANSGSGLGLAIAKGLVEAHAGTISVDHAGAGCRFTVTLPLAAAESLHELAAATA